MRDSYGSPAWHRPPRLWALVFVVLGGLPATSQAQSNRDSWQRVPDVLAAMAIGEGSRVADVGAGSGYFTERLARQVGASGTVFAVDISERALSQLRQLVEDRGLKNVEIVRGELDDPRLPEASLDAILVVDAYHEMTEHEAMLAGMRRALRPGGRLVMLDMTPRDPDHSRSEQVSSHRLGIEMVAQEVQIAGFEVLQRDPEFAQPSGGRVRWLLVARR
jgi:ubiquinone/menaquinone biosynthesis C-methylase UbiE